MYHLYSLQYIFFHISPYFVIRILWWILLLGFAWYIRRDWHKLRALLSLPPEKNAAFSERQCYLAWIIKNVLIILFLYNIVHDINRISYFSQEIVYLIQHHEPSGEYPINFFYKEAPVEISTKNLPSSGQDTHQTEKRISIENGSIPEKSIIAMTMTWGSIFFHAFLTLILYYYLILLFSYLAQRKPFIADNVRILQIIACIYMVEKLGETGFRTMSDMYFNQKYTIVYNSADFLQKDIKITCIDYSSVFIFITILLLAEAIRYGYKLKEDQDLTI